MVFTNSKKPKGNLLLYKQVLVFFGLFLKKMMQMKYPDEKKPFNEPNYVRDWFQDFEILFKLFFKDIFNFF